MENENFLFLHRICRICLDHGDHLNLVPILNSNCPLNYYEMLMVCSNGRISFNDCFPNSICNGCIYRLTIAYEFRQQCEISEARLRQYYGYELMKNCIPSSTTTMLPVPDVTETREWDTVCQIFNTEPSVLPATPVEIELIEKELIIDDTISHENPLDQRPELNNDKNDMTDKETVSELAANHQQYRNNPIKTCSNVDKCLIKRMAQRKLERIREGCRKKPNGKCLDCGKTFRYTGYLEAHIRTHTGEKPFTCDICTMKFSQIGNLALHRRIHTGERPYQCERCSKQFTTSSNLKAHQRIHTGLKSFQCNQCAMTFISKGELESHAGTHSGLKTNVCKVCGKTFYKKAYLNSHIRTVHRGEKRYHCTQCGKEFANSSNLTCHFRIHTGEKPYQCNVCKAKFNQSSALVRHSKQHLNG